MDRIAEWRPVEPTGPDRAAEPGRGDPSAPNVPGPPPAARSGQGWGLMSPILIGLTILGFALAGGIAAFVYSTMPRPAVAIDGSASTGPGASASSDTPRSGASAGSPGVVVDVEGAVERPGLWHLPAGSRVGDAVEAAGGYSAQVDIAAATIQLNLAQVLIDGQQIRVPLRGDGGAPASTSTASSATPAASAAGLIDVNSASASELDTLPGIGPATAAKIIAARPYASIDDLGGRGVVSASTMEKIRPLITVGP